MEAGGAISGANFGLYYTVLMQIGYNHFAKIAIEKIKQGQPVASVLREIAQEIAPFNDAMVQMAFDRLPKVTEQMIQSGIDFVGGSAKTALTGAGPVGVDPQAGAANFQAFENWLKSTLNPLPSAEARRGSTSTVQHISPQIQSTSPISRRVSTPDLSKYNSMNVNQLQSALLRTQGTEKSYVRKQIAKRLQAIKDRPRYSGDESRKIITFTYSPVIKKGKYFRSLPRKTQTYAFDYNGHIRKAKQLKSAYNRDFKGNATARTLLNQLIAYTEAIKLAWPTKKLLI